MKKFLVTLLTLLSLTATARETITVVLPSSASQSTVPLALRTLDKANELQTQFNFVPEFKPGANGALALKYMDQSPQNRISGIAPAFIENAKTGLINENDYVPVSAWGDTCWTIITNIGDTKRGVASLANYRGKEIVVGGTGYGNAAHLTSLILAEKYGFKVKYIVFKSNFDALVNMAGDNGVNFLLESVQSYNQFKDRQPKLQMLGMNCPIRSHHAPELKTLREQGFDTPAVFNITVANRAMDNDKRLEIRRALHLAKIAIGQKEILEISNLLPPLFSGISEEEFYTKRIGLIKRLVERYEKEIEASK